MGAAHRSLIGGDNRLLRVLYSFTNGTDGKRPQAGLLAASDGALYGTTSAGSSNRGIVFKIDTDGGGFQILHTFTGKPDGQQPTCKLVEGSDGALYGTTQGGGTSLGGTVFKINKDGNGYGILYNFVGGSGASLPYAGLIKGSDGFLYGTTYYGPGFDFVGTIFQISEDGLSYQTQYSFPATGDLQGPAGELLEGPDNALYGVAGRSLASPYSGGIFKVNKDGSDYTVLRAFGSIPDGAAPNCALVELNNIFYGTTEMGGTLGFGCVFALSSSPLPPRITSLATSGTTNTLQIVATSASQFAVERSTNLADWSVITTLTSPLSCQTNFPDLGPPQPSAFYRLHQH